MKIRMGHVTNSSSSSFVVDIKHITPKQKKYIYRHQTEAHKWMDRFDLPCMWGTNYLENEVLWRIIERNGQIQGMTWMDNFDMKAFMELIGVDVSKVKFTPPGSLSYEEMETLYKMQ